MGSSPIVSTLRPASRTDESTGSAGSYLSPDRDGQETAMSLPEVTTREQRPIDLVIPLMKQLSGIGG